MVEATAIKNNPITGTAMANDFLTYNGATSEWNPRALSAVAPITFNDSTRTIGAIFGTTSTTIASGDDPRFSTAEIVKVKQTNAGSGEFTSIRLAVLSISDASASKPYIVAVGPGLYVEQSIILPAYVAIIGENPLSTIVMPVGTTGTLFTMSANSTLHGMTITGTTGTTDIAIMVNSVTNVVIFHCVLRNFGTIFSMKAPTGIAGVLLNACNINGGYKTFADIDGTNLNSSFLVRCVLNNMLVVATPNTTNTAFVRGPHVDFSFLASKITHTSDATACGFSHSYREPHSPAAIMELL